MSEHPTKRRLNDAQVAEILIYDTPVAELADRFGVSTNAVASIRRRSSYRAIKMAETLGLIGPKAERAVWIGRNGSTAFIWPSAGVRA